MSDMHSSPSREKPFQVDAERASNRGSYHRELKNRHVAMISIGSVILGTGLFLGTASALMNGGHVGLSLGYMFIGSICDCVMLPADISSSRSALLIQHSHSHWDGTCGTTGRSFLRYLKVLTGILSLGMTKLANTLYASELQRRLTAIGSRIIVISLHPGGVYTYFNRPSIPYYHFIFTPIIFLFFSHPDKGAYNSVFAAVSEDVIKEREKYRDAYLTPVRRVSKPTKMARNEELAKELMNSVDVFLQEKGI